MTNKPNNQELLHETPMNKAHLMRASELWSNARIETLRKGWTGKWSLTLSIEDGTIQDVQQNVEQRHH